MELTNSRFDGAVSPVVGVILMVAVTVILAAVIGTFVLDLGNNVQENPQAGVSFDEDAGTSVTVQVISAENVDDIRATADSGGSHTISGAGAGDTIKFMTSGAADGSEDATYTAGDSITVVGTLDGKEAVLQTYDTAA